MNIKIRKFFATAPKGMSGLLANELSAHGASKIQQTASGASFEGSLETAYRLCLWGRIVNRVLLPVTTLSAKTPEQLYEGIKAIRWEKHLSSEGSLAVDCTRIRASITHSKYAALKTKDAIVDRFREQFGERPSVDLDHPDLRINLNLVEDRGRVSIDLSGGSLHRRGYRLEGVAAPLKENLAAAILLAADWPDIAKHGGPLLDPMCGSGTLLVEGALIAADIAPGLYRNHFGFLFWRGHDEALWESLLEEARERRERGLETLPPILGFDSNAEAIQAARANIDRAGLRGQITVEQRAFDVELPLPEDKPGLLAVNPPYGERLGDINELKPLYSRIGDLLQQRLQGWNAVVITSNPELAAHIGLRSKQPLLLYNGPLECRLFRYRVADNGHPSDEMAEVNPALAQSPGALMFANRVRKNLKHLGKWARREGINCYRLYDSDLPEYAVAVDLYQGEKRWVHVQEYKAPKSIDADRALERLQEVLAVLPSLLKVPAGQIYFKVRQRQKGRSQYDKFDSSRRFHEVREGNCRLLVNFSDYLDTGLFLDHRITRKLIGQRAQGKYFLNLFAYTGSATVHAAAGGAKTTTSVDMSHTYIEWAKRNMALNGFTGRAHEFIQADCLKWLDEAVRKGKKYDLIFLDPPTFSSSKRMAGSFDIQSDHVKLIRNCIALLRNGGLLIFSNNFRKFRLDREALSDLKIEDISRKSLPEDFKRNPHIHQCWLIEKGS
jgi:23S rRNA (guanine2445-N2)-methyltransferase / 23S rRNA (guanine2069-N7)-methyltransferase